MNLIPKIVINLNEKNENYQNIKYKWFHIKN